MKTSIVRHLFYPVVLVVLIWCVKIIEYLFNLSFIEYGVYPRKIEGLTGVLFSFFIHKDFTHLINNTIPLLVLTTLLFYFYKKISIKLLFHFVLVSGLLTWSIARDSYHIGASGGIYAIASFLVISGIIRNNPKLSAVSFVVVFLYGSLVWGILPIEEHISWEGHLSGMVTGFLIAYFYKEEGPKRKKYQWEIDEELEKKQKKGIECED